MSKLDAFTWGGIGPVIGVAAAAVIALTAFIAVDVTRAVRRWQAGRRAGRRIGASIAAIGGDVIAIFCDPCNNRPGSNCICTSKQLCSHPLCGAADTGVSLYSDRDARWLRTIGVSEPTSLPTPPDIPGEKPS